MLIHPLKILMGGFHSLILMDGQLSLKFLYRIKGSHKRPLIFFLRLRELMKGEASYGKLNGIKCSITPRRRLGGESSFVRNAPHSPYLL